jgi:pilus assembly protein CpaD
MKPATHRLTLIAASAVLLLAACNAPDLTAYDVHKKYPLTVEQKMAVLIAEPGPDGTIQPADRARFGELAVDYRDRAAGPIDIVVGAKGPADPVAQAFARNIRDALTAEGVPGSFVQIAFSTGGAASGANRATVTLPLYVAVVPDCGMSNTQPDVDYFNANSDNFGCAMQRNIGLMAVNPLDLQQMQPSTGRWGTRGHDIINKYGQGQAVPSANDLPTSITQSSFGSGSGSN